MAAFRAVTFSGAVYELKHGILHVDSKRTGATVFKPWHMQSAKDPQVLPWEPSDIGSPWVEVAKPVVGERFYAAGKDEWRISTEIVSVEDLVEKDESDDDD